jgi:asparagine synthase (glutamine-hydrolysing)
MCGIIGHFSSKPPSEQVKRFEEATSMLHHRGPDDCGFEMFSTGQGRLTLGHTRLSIIDLSTAGHQPMNSGDQRYTIVFNGEIYNYLELRQELRSLGYSFTSNSDTEVLLACWCQWGDSCLPRLRGMFAFAIFDKKTNRLVCARDAFGIKPFYYHQQACGFLFASELVALMKLLPDRPVADLQQASDYIIHGTYDNSNRSFIKDTRQLLPGHMICVDLNNPGAATQKRWWWPSVRTREKCDAKDFESAAMQLREMFLESVRMHLRSDVPLGVAVSGGLDSSAVVCAVRSIEPKMPIHSFCYVARDSKFNEEKWVDTVNEYVQAIPHKIVIDPNDLSGDIEDLVSAQGEPFGGTSIYAQYRVFKSVRESGITVTLEGQGADELLAGYQGFAVERVNSLIERREFKKACSFLYNWSTVEGRGLLQGTNVVAQQLLLQGIRHRIRKLRSAPRWLDQAYLRNSGVDQCADVSTQQSDAVGRRVVDALRRSLTSSGLPALLRHSDRNAMRWSIESRVPFLTTEIAEFLLSLPEHFLVSDRGETKSIFRAAMRGLVPDVILDRKDKIGFATPETPWLRQIGMRSLDLIDGIESIPFLHVDECVKDIREFVSGRRRYSSRIWRLINYCVWARIFNVKF